MESPPPPPPPPQPPKESLVRSYKFVWRVLLISNLALGAYIFTRPRKKEAVKKDKKPLEVQPVPEINTIPDSEGAAAATATNPAYEPEKMPDPVPENQWSKPFKW